jgi:hypothetical protein
MIGEDRQTEGKVVASNDMVAGIFPGEKGNQKECTQDLFY